MLFRTPRQTSEFSSTIVFRRAAACSFFSPSFGDFEIESGQLYEGRDSRVYFTKFPRRLVVDADYDIPLCDRHKIALRPAVVF